MLARKGRGLAPTDLAGNCGSLPRSRCYSAGSGAISATISCPYLPKAKGHGSLTEAEAIPCLRIRARSAPFGQSKATSVPNDGSASSPSGQKGRLQASPLCRLRLVRLACASYACGLSQVPSPAFNGLSSASVCSPVVTGRASGGPRSRSPCTLVAPPRP